MTTESNSAHVMNLLLICSDEHDPRYMGCSGHPFVKTPNLDRLAARGTRFTNAWTPCPICVPARGSLATGRYVHQTGYWDNAIAYEGRIPGWGHRLQANGMRVESIGKLHYHDIEDPTGFDRQQIPMHIWEGVGLLWGSVRDPMPEKAARSPLFDELGAGTSRYNLYDKNIAELAVQWFAERAANPDPTPWTLFLGFVAPHMPLVVPQKYLDMYPPELIPPAKLHPDDGFMRHPWVERMAQHWDHDAALGTAQRRKLATACYFGLITFLDDQVGKVLAALEANGFARSTRVIYTTDHGDNLGARGMWNKSVMYKEATAIPMIACGPGFAQGTVCDTNVNLVDIYPTVLDCMGLDKTQGEQDLPGKSLLRIAAEPTDTGRYGFSEYHAVGAETSAFMLVKGRFKYHYYVGFVPELFDLETDPQETCNLANHPLFAEIAAGFEAHLRSMLDPEEVDRRARTEQRRHVDKFGGPQAVATMGNPGATPAPSNLEG